MLREKTIKKGTIGKANYLNALLSIQLMSAVLLKERTMRPIIFIDNMCQSNAILFVIRHKYFFFNLPNIGNETLAELQTFLLSL
jgi:hypothetical protein